MLLRILSYNIHKGLTIWNTKFILDRIRTALRETNADILFLQEVLGGHSASIFKLKNSETEKQFEYLADNIWPHHAYGKNAVYTEGHHGNAILSKYPIIEWSNQTISKNRSEPRGLLRAKIHIPGTDKEIFLANTHLDLTQTGRDDQTEELVRSLNGITHHPWILVGDFNDWNKKISDRIEKGLNGIEVFKLLDGSYARTFPSFLPILSLDRIFLGNLKPLKASRLMGRSWSGLSDHVPLYVEVDLREVG